MESAADFMEDHAVGTTRIESYTPQVEAVEAGHLTEGAEYATYRSGGTTDWLLIQTLAGAGRFGIDTAEVIVGPDSVALLRPGTVHDYGSHHDHWELRFAHFHPRAEWLALLDWPEAAPGLRLLDLSPALSLRVADALALAARHTMSGVARAQLFGANAVELALLWCDTQNPGEGEMDDRVLAVIEHIGRHLTDPLSIADLAAVANLSTSRLGHLFAEQVGSSPQQFVQARRIGLAKQLLDLTNRPIADIAAEVGYPDPLYFSTRFRRQVGLSPSAYRARSRG
ncbi:helix-turn-helix domain-containing protein [Microlunatus speluncae]|uniref:helix-turn-helix domain-containing protein n=1 Tax=Microlunatus speluncae TaxID=2594267 RepID=UPI001FEC43CA|nr:helix-turn-helix domain-containing protein [Microlunatus speluncae]